MISWPTNVLFFKSFQNKHPLLVNWTWSWLYRDLTSCSTVIWYLLCLVHLYWIKDTCTILAKIWKFSSTPWPSCISYEYYHVMAYGTKYCELKSDQISSFNWERDCNLFSLKNIEGWFVGESYSYNHQPFVNGINVAAS